MQRNFDFNFVGTFSLLISKSIFREMEIEILILLNQNFPNFINIDLLLRYFDLKSILRVIKKTKFRVYKYISI